MPEAASTKVSRLGRRIRVLIADDHPVIRRALRSTLQVRPEIEVCGEAMDGSEAIEEAKKLKPDVVVLNGRHRHIGEWGGVISRYDFATRWLAPAERRKNAGLRESHESPGIPRDP